MAKVSSIKIYPEVEKFISSLEKPTIAKALKTIDLLTKFGYQLGMPHSKKITTELYELRIRGQQEIRIFYAFSNQKIILLHGFVKKSQALPEKEIKMAASRLTRT